MSTTADYLGRITPQHADKPSFLATVQASVDPFAAVQGILAGLPAAFDLDAAAGAQLDAVGERVGISRYVSTPLPNVYFSFGVAGLGWGEGAWRGPYDAAEGLTALDDGSYRTLIRAKIAANQWDGTLASAAKILALILPDPTSLLVLTDNQDMSITLAISGTAPDAVTRALLGKSYVPVKPGGVAMKPVVTSVSGAPCFGFGADNQYVGGWGTGTWATPL